MKSSKCRNLPRQSNKKHTWCWHKLPLSDKRVVVWLDDRKVFPDFPVAFWNQCWLYFLLHAITEQWNKFVLSCHLKKCANFHEILGEEKNKVVISTMGELPWILIFNSKNTPISTKSELKTKRKINKRSSPKKLRKFPRILGWNHKNKPSLL